MEGFLSEIDNIFRILQQQQQNTKRNQLEKMRTKSQVARSGFPSEMFIFNLVNTMELIQYFARMRFTDGKS